jgi:hypothetical protein
MFRLALRTLAITIALSTAACGDGNVESSDNTGSAADNSSTSPGDLHDANIGMALNNPTVANNSPSVNNVATPANNTAEDTDVQLTEAGLLVDGQPFFVQGVAWNPVPAGGLHPRDLDFAGYVEQDSQMMQQAGLNVVRTYEPITDRAVLDTLYSRGIYVMNTVYPFGGSDPGVVRERVEAVADHPAILMWVIGNEWNYNGMYAGLSFEQSVARINAVAQVIREVDTTHPISTIYGELPSRETVEAMPLIDAWGINAYRGMQFGDLFDRWQAISDKPMYLGEFGADAWNANIGAEDQAAQAEATVALIGEIGANGHDSGGPCLGGVLFEFADEWWKDGSGSPDQHDIGGVAPGGGPHPDATFNEEWWGLVTVDRQPRQAYHDLPRVW